jgi:hypothetical protein
MDSLDGRYYYLEKKEEKKIEALCGELVISTFNNLIKATYQDEECNQGFLSGSIGCFGELMIDTLSVDVEREGVGGYLFKSVVDEFDVTRTSSRLNGANYSTFIKGVNLGLTFEEALGDMPSVKVRASVGFSSFEFEFLGDRLIHMNAYK